MYFDKFAQQGNTFLKEVAFKLGDEEERGRALRVTRAVFHALRARIPMTESLQLLAQLPLYLKAIYVDGWKPRPDDQRIRHLEDFLALVKREAGHTADNDFWDEWEVFGATRAVISVMRNHVSDGEIEDIKSTLPEELHELFEGR
jgi:uncharacterized protein (DUF2267 family)